ncbi:hypothetical protein ACFV29_03880 [Streptomyces sp. NPDC059690]|uniref:hypothetical protein n=1 Tax=Streptomyces sp. NPDC059690 TaxID=3346907 RepID=UPI0036AA490B
MIVLLLLALLVLALVVWRAMDKAAEADVTSIVRFALAAIVTLVLSYVAMRVVPPEAVPEVLHAALKALKPR